MAREIHVHDWGTELLATIRDHQGPVDMDDYTGYNFRFKAPNTPAVQVQPAIFGPRENGQLIYIVPLSFAGSSDGWFFHTKGPWKWQVTLGSPIGVWHSNVITFQVYDNI